MPDLKPLSNEMNGAPKTNVLKNLTNNKGTSSSTSTSPARSLGFTILGEIFAYVTVFNIIIEVATFRLRGKQGN